MSLEKRAAKWMSWRHELHENPEVGFNEFETVKRLKGWIKGVFDEVLFVDVPESKTGFYFDIAGNGPKCSKPKCIALRADMDALPSTEAVDGLAGSHRSKNEGRHHGCGHDLHMVSLVAAVELIVENRVRFPGNCRVRVFFQPAEEGLGGALPMAESTMLDGVDEVYGFHNWPTYPVGTVAVCSGPIMAHCTEFKIKIRGKGTHASAPHTGIDPLVCACAVVSALQTVVSRSIDSAAQAVVTVGYLHAGETHNVIGDHAVLGGTIRDFDPIVSAAIYERVRAIVSGTAAAHGCQAEVDLVSGYPAVVNHATETDIVRRVAASCMDAVTDQGLPVLAGEDFAYYLERRPGCFFFLGSAHPHENPSPMLHNARFDCNDDLTPKAANLWLQLVFDRFSS